MHISVGAQGIAPQPWDIYKIRSTLISIPFAIPLATTLWYRTGDLLRSLSVCRRHIADGRKGWGNPTPTTSIELRRLKSCYCCLFNCH
jgi:hypothetical protein